MHPVPVSRPWENGCTGKQIHLVLFHSKSSLHTVVAVLTFQKNAQALDLKMKAQHNLTHDCMLGISVDMLSKSSRSFYINIWDLGIFLIMCRIVTDIPGQSLHISPGESRLKSVHSSFSVACGLARGHSHGDETLCVSRVAECFAKYWFSMWTRGNPLSTWTFENLRMHSLFLYGEMGRWGESSLIAFCFSNWMCKMQQGSCCSTDCHGTY